MQHETLISATELMAMQAGGVPLVVLDCSFDLGDTSAGERAYAAGHLPGAHYAHLDRDLSGPKDGRNGRHPLPDRQALARVAGRWGVRPGVQVVAYDDQGLPYAARAWWLLRWLGHEAVAVLNGGFAAWQAAGMAVETHVRRRDPRLYVPHLKADRSVVTDEVVKQRAAGSILLVDARSPDRFAGQNETLDPVAGHVPDALNRPFTANLGPDGRFLPATVLHEQWKALLAGRPATELVSMCGSGVTACHNLLALEHAGLTGARLYAGSWSEWIRDPARPVATTDS